MLANARITLVAQYIFLKTWSQIFHQNLTFAEILVFQSCAFQKVQKHKIEFLRSKIEENLVLEMHVLLEKAIFSNQFYIKT